jgi:hypothetical protein
MLTRTMTVLMAATLAGGLLATDAQARWVPANPPPKPPTESSIGLGLGLAGLDYGYDYSYGSAATPLATGRSVAAAGNYCATPMQACSVHHTSYAGDACFCRISGGYVQGTVQ